MNGSLVSHLYFGLALCHHTVYQNVLNNQLYITLTLYESWLLRKSKAKKSDSALGSICSRLLNEQLGEAPMTRISFIKLGLQGAFSLNLLQSCTRKSCPIKSIPTSASLVQSMQCLCRYIFGFDSSMYSSMLDL